MKNCELCKSEYKPTNNRQMFCSKKCQFKSKKSQRQEYYQKHKEKISIRGKGYYLKHKEKIDLRQAKYVETNREEVKQKAKERYKNNLVYKQKIIDKACRWQKNNPQKVAERTARRRASKLNATPKWQTDKQKKQITEIHARCKKTQEVDHVYPLQGKNVCGLHVPWNLEILLKKDNQRKSNSTDNIYFFDSLFMSNLRWVGSETRLEVDLKSVFKICKEL